MSSDALYAPTAAQAAAAHADKETYDAMYAASIADPAAFWGEHGKRIDWIKPYSKVKDTSYAPGNVSIKWYEDGTLNVSANCIDRHLATRGDQTAIIWEPDSPTDDAKHITYKQLHASVCKFANVLKEMGVGKGDRVVIYMPMIPWFLARCSCCARERVGSKGCHHSGRSPARWPQYTVEGECRQSVREDRGRHEDFGRSAHRRRCRDDRRS